VEPTGPEAVDRAVIAAEPFTVNVAALLVPDTLVRRIVAGPGAASAATVRPREKCMPL
jgi:hypothetical protein